MPHASSIAIVLQRGLVERVIVEGWPPNIPLPSIVVVNNSVEFADDDEITEFTIGSDNYAAVCHEIEPTVYELQDSVLSPKKLLTFFYEAAEAAEREPVWPRFFIPRVPENESSTQDNCAGAHLNSDQRRYLVEQLRCAVGRQPELTQLRKILLGIGGYQLLAHVGDSDPELPLLLAEGRTMGGLITLLQMPLIGNPTYLAGLWRARYPGMIGICTGYALGEDCLWRKHFWGLMRDGILEPAALFAAYFGVSCSPEMSDRLATTILTSQRDTYFHTIGNHAFGRGSHHCTAGSHTCR
jgi:hypothetical protein